MGEIEVRRGNVDIEAALDGLIKCGVDAGLNCLLALYNDVYKRGSESDEKWVNRR